MVCIRTCDKCGKLHAVGAKCPKPLTSEEFSAWAAKFLKSHREFLESSWESMKKDKSRRASHA